MVLYNGLIDMAYILVPVDLGDYCSEGWSIYLEPFNEEKEVK